MQSESKTGRKCNQMTGCYRNSRAYCSQIMICRHCVAIFERWNWSWSIFIVARRTCEMLCNHISQVSGTFIFPNSYNWKLLTLKAYAQQWGYSCLWSFYWTFWGMYFARSFYGQFPKWSNVSPAFRSLFLHVCLIILLFHQQNRWNFSLKLHLCHHTNLKSIRIILTNFWRT